MNNLIFGTAGHVDHGKTALIKALSGFEGDSTNEEKRRKITIDLSFSNMQNNDRNIAFIDVPGHEKLVKNMIAGAFGFDGALVVMDAKEGIMPQLKEHLEILNFLQISRIIIVITKKDLVEPSKIDERKNEIIKFLENFPNLKILSIFSVSIKDEKSIEELKNFLFSLPLSIDESTQNKGKIFRYYIDRKFSIKGQGTVVTGTVLENEVEVNEKIMICQLNKEVKIKNIQVHEKNVQIAIRGQRAALGLSNIDTKDLEKGMLLTKKGYLRGFNKIDCLIQTWDKFSLKHNQTVTIHLGTNQLEAKILNLDSQESFEYGFCSLEFSQKVFCVFDEKFIITASGRTVGGGRVLNPIIDPIKKKIKIDFLKNLAAYNFKESFKVLLNVHKKGFGLISSYQRFKLTHEEILILIKGIDSIFVDDQNLVAYPQNTLENLSLYIINKFNNNPSAMLSETSIALKLKWASSNLIKNVLETLKNEGFLIFQNGVYIKKGVNLEDLKSKTEEKIYQIIKNSKYLPDAPYNIYDNLDIDRKTGDDALKKLCVSKKIIRLTHNLFIESEVLAEILKILREIIKTQGYVDVQSVKSNLNLTRKFAIAYLEYLDNFDDIYKEGSVRKLI